MEMTCLMLCFLSLHLVVVRDVYHLSIYDLIVCSTAQSRYTTAS